MTMQTSEGGVIVHDARRDVAPAKATDLLSVIAQAAADPRCDVDKMQALFEMRNAEIARVAQLEFADAMSAAQSEMKPVVKSATNLQTKSKYARLEHIVAMITPVYTAHGFSMSFGTVPGAPEGCIRTVCDVRHRGGHSEHYELDMELDDSGIQGARNKTGPHARGSSISYSRRYLTCMVWNIPTFDDDDGNFAGGAVEPEPDPQMLPITEAEQIEILERLEAIGVEPEVFCKVCKVSSVSEIPKGKLPGVLKRLAQREEASKG